MPSRYTEIINFILEVHICALSQMHAHTLHTMTVYNIPIIMYYVYYSHNIIMHSAHNIHNVTIILGLIQRFVAHHLFLYVYQRGVGDHRVGQ